MSVATPARVQAAAMTAPGKMELREYPFPQMDHDSAILKIDMTGVCGTDKHLFKGEATTLRGKSIFPYVGGHEIIGTIVEIGENAARVMDYDRQPLKTGDRVAVAVEVNCGTCWYCRNHYNNTTCENQVMAYGLHPNADTAPYLRGGWSEYMYVMPGTHLFKVPEDLPTEVAVFVEELAVAYHSLARSCGPFSAVKEGFGPGDSVAVLGNGPLGILHGIMASIHGAGMRIATDLADLRLTKAKELYADVIINASSTTPEERIQQVRDLTEGVGPDLVIESAGEPEVFIEALQMVRKGGTVIEVGNWVDLGKGVNLDVMRHIASKNLHIHSVFHCGTNWRPVLKILQQQRANYRFESLITHRFHLPELVDCMGIVADPNECVKIEAVPHARLAMLTRRQILQGVAGAALLPPSERRNRPMHLKVSNNRRFLAREDDTPFFYLGDTAWELFHRLNREEADLYLENRAARGFTVIQAVDLAELDGLHTPNPYGHTPLHGDDPTKPNEAYFQHVDYVVNKAESLGMYIGMLPTWGDKWNKKWGVGPEIFTPENARIYGAWLAKRYADKPILWILGGDRPPETDAHKAIIRAMASGIRATVGTSQLISYHTYGGHSSAKYFHGDDWLDFNMFQTGHKRDQENWRSIGQDYDRTPVKPCMDAEPGYENIPNDFNDTDARLQAHHCRKFLYWALFAGAHGHTYGCNDIWQMWAPGRQSTIHADLPWNKAIDLPGAAQMHHAKDLLLARPFFTRIPDHSLIVSDTYSGGSHIAATRDSENSYALVYSASGRSFTIDLGKLSGRLRAAWFDPRTGTSQPAETVEAAGEKEFVPPSQGETQDWVLTLDRE